MTPPGSSKRGRGRMELQMTPMIDIVFNLVIFFILMPSFQSTEGYLPTNLPGGGQIGPEPAPGQVLRVNLRHVEPWAEHRDEVRIVLNSEELPGYGALRERLREARRSLRGSPVQAPVAAVVIAPDQVVQHKHVVAAFDAAIDAGFKDIRFTVPK